MPVVEYKNNTEKRTPNEVNVKKAFLIVLAAYSFLIVSFYFLAGEQLRFRVSRNNINLPQADSGTVELSTGVKVEQVFCVKIQRLQTISVEFGGYYRENRGTVTMELYQISDGNLLMCHDFNATDVSEGTILSMSVDKPLENVYDIPLKLKIYADSQPGEGVTPLMCAGSPDERYILNIDGEPRAGMLCFSATGEDYIWTGLHYWEFSTVLGAVLGLLLLTVWRRYKDGKRSYIVNALTAVKKYRFLIHQLVSRDFKTKYKRSILGVFWSFLNPLLTMSVQYFVFSTLFRNDVENFAAYLLIGVVTYNFFSEVCSMSLTSVLGNASLITKVYMPKYIYPLTRTMSSVVNLLISMIPLVIVCAITGIPFRRSMLLSLFFFLCLTVFSFGLGMLLATSMVFFRDTQFLWNVISMMWMYATPIFYPETILPNMIQTFEQFNPLYCFLKNIRICIMEGISPEPSVYVYSLLFALGMLVIGSVAFAKKQDEFVLYL